MLVSLLLEPRPAQVVDPVQRSRGRLPTWRSLDDRGGGCRGYISPAPAPGGEGGGQAGAHLHQDRSRRRPPSRRPAPLPPRISWWTPPQRPGRPAPAAGARRRRPEDLVAMQSAAGAAPGPTSSWPRGAALHSVCTNEQEETEAVAQRFGRASPTWSLVEESRLPGVAGARPRGGTLSAASRDGTDGFFMALWEKKGP